MIAQQRSRTRNYWWLLRILYVLVLLYLFLVGIKLLESAFKSVGTDTAREIIEDLRNPFVGLAAGVLMTVLVQSSSVTTTTIVGLVSVEKLGLASAQTEALPLSVAVPMVMGANIGTTVTNTLVSLGHVTRKDEFRRAFAGATVHDFFNLLTVVVLFPLELATGFLQQTAQWLAGFVPATEAGTFSSPIKQAVSWLAKQMVGAAENGLGLAGPWLAVILAGLGITVIIISLIYITKTMKVLMANRIEEWLNRVLYKSGLLGLAIGIVMTVSVQSSSITTSLLIPMFGSGLLRVEAGFPIMVGSNIGTTVTALLAASVTGTNGLTIALVHLLFNLCGTLIFFPAKPMRRIPVWLGERLADLAVRNRTLVLIYVGIVFVGFPLLGIWLF